MRSLKLSWMERSTRFTRILQCISQALLHDQISTKALYRAGTPEFQDRIFIIVLDEMNLSRPEQFFADFLSALEQPEDDVFVNITQ